MLASDIGTAIRSPTGQ